MSRRLPRLLWWLRPNTFQADDAISVVFVDRYQLRYRDGGRSMLVFQELMSDPKLVGIDRESMESWEPPHEREFVSEAHKDRIIANMRRAFATRGYVVEVLNE